MMYAAQVAEALQTLMTFFGEDVEFDGLLDLARTGMSEFSGNDLETLTTAVNVFEHLGLM